MAAASATLCCSPALGAAAGLGQCSSSSTHRPRIGGAGLAALPGVSWSRRSCWVEGSRVSELWAGGSLSLSRRTSLLQSCYTHQQLGGRGPGLHVVGAKKKVKMNDSFDSAKDGVSKAAKKLKDESSKSGSKLRIGIYFIVWWGLNIVFNIYNKKVLNVYPYPWLTSVLALLAGTLIMLASWCTGCVQAPETDLEFWKNLFPVAVAHSVGHVAATISMSRSAIAFTQIIKSAEPAFSVVISRLLLGESYLLPVYLSLLPIVGGCCLAAVTELNFDMIGFLGANVSNVAFVFRNFFSKRGMSKKVSGLNYYGCLCIMSLAILTPFAVFFEGFRAWSVGWHTTRRAIGTPFICWLIAQSVFYHLYNQASYMSLDHISPLSFSIGNTMKRVSVIAASIVIFKTPVQPVNLIGAAIAIFGTFLYSQASK